MQQPTNEKLHRTMKSRHLFMIALGGVIGTGFFLGSVTLLIRVTRGPSFHI